MKLRKGLVGMIAVLFLGLLISCEENTTGEMPGEMENQGKVVFRITDAPFPSKLVAEANITVDWVQLYSESTNEELEDEEYEFYTIELTEDPTFNLLSLSNGITELLGEVEVPVGVYREIRMHILDAEIILTDGTVYDLKVPSGSSSGLKIKVNPSVVVNEGEEVVVLLDVDVSRSFVMKGNFNSKNGKNNIQGFNFKPVIRAVPQLVAGQISGVVADTSGVMLEDALITLLAGTDTVTTALTSEEGFYAIIGIPDGVYSIACSKPDYEGQVFKNIEISAGDILEQDFLLVPQEGEDEE